MNKSILGSLNSRGVALVLAIIGLVLIGFGVGVWFGVGPGLIVGGLACWVLEWRITS